MTPLGLGVSRVGACRIVFGIFFRVVNAQTEPLCCWCLRLAFAASAAGEDCSEESLGWVCGAAVCDAAACDVWIPTGWALPRNVLCRTALLSARIRLLGIRVLSGTFAVFGVVALLVCHSRRSVRGLRRFTGRRWCIRDVGTSDAGVARYLHSVFPRMPKLPLSGTAGLLRGCAAPPRNNHSGRRLWYVPGLPHRASDSDQNRHGEAQKSSRPRRPQRRSARLTRRRIRSSCPRWKPALSRTGPQEYPE